LPINHGASHLITDQIGSVRLVVNTSTGAIAQRLDYDEFGNTVVDTAPGFQPFQYAGGLRDIDTGMVRFGARDYDARVGRWTAKDALRFEGGLANLYVYAGSDPVNNADPSGLYITPTHQEILHDAFGGRVSPTDLAILLRANHDIDWAPGAQALWNQYKHGLHTPAQSIPVTRELFSSFVARQLNQAVALEKRGCHEEAVYELGLGMHSLADTFSPAHEGFSEYGGFWQNTGHIGLDLIGAFTYEASGPEAALTVRAYYQVFLARTR